MRKYLIKSKGWFLLYLLALLINEVIVVSVAMYLRYVIDAAAAMDEAKLIESIYLGLLFVGVFFFVGLFRRMCKAKYTERTMTALKNDLSAVL